VELTRTPRLLLRHWRDEDAAAFFDLYSREEVMRWLGPQPRRTLATREEADARLARWRANEEVLDPPYGLWAMVPLEPRDAAPVGTVLLLPLTEDDAVTDEVEVGWHLHPDHQGAGLATEAARAVLALAGEAGICDVLALTDLDNTASQAVARRLGMADEGVTDRWFGLTLRQFRRDGAVRPG
jgi:RimJ/RimL family protein N-acetyltransferase